MCSCLPFYTRKEALANQIENKISVNAWDKLYKAELFRNIRYPIGRNFEDMAVILPLIGETNKIYVLNECLVMHRKRPGSIMTTLTTRSIYEKMMSQKDYICYIRNHMPLYFSKRHWNIAIQNWYSCLIGYYFTLIGAGIKKHSPIIRCLNRELSICKSSLDHNDFYMKLRIKDFLFLHMQPDVGSFVFYILKSIKGFYLAIMDGQFH